VRFTTFQINTRFAWLPVRLSEPWRGRHEWAWLERVESNGTGGFRRLGIPASPEEVGKNLEKIAAGKYVVRPEGV